MRFTRYRNKWIPDILDDRTAYQSYYIIMDWNQYGDLSLNSEFSFHLKISAIKVDLTQKLSNEKTLGYAHINISCQTNKMKKNIYVKFRWRDIIA